MTTLIVALSSLALAAEHVDTLGSSTYSADANDACMVDVVTVEAAVTLTKVEAYLDENDSSSSPKVSFAMWSRVGSAAWSRSVTLDSSVTVSTSTGWYASDALNTPLTVGTTYAIGFCSTYAINGFYSTAAPSSGVPVWGSMDGWDLFDLTSLTPASTVSTGKGVYLRYTVTAADADRDGFDSIDDCDDSSATVNPDASEVWYDGIDEDCAGGDDYDQDGDEHQSDAYGGDDCDDTDPRVNPDASRDTWYDGIDQNCDGLSDYDKDRDGEDSSEYGGVDCDDDNPDINTAATESWYDGIDQNCDGASDYDQDGDGHDAQSVGGDDCDDTDASVNVDCSGGGNGGGGNGGGNGGGGNGGTDTGTADDSGSGKGCCGGGSAMMLSTLMWSLTKRRKVA